MSRPHRQEATAQEQEEETRQPRIRNSLRQDNTLAAQLADTEDSMDARFNDAEDDELRFDSDLRAYLEVGITNGLRFGSGFGPDNGRANVPDNGRANVPDNGRGTETRIHQERIVPDQQPSQQDLLRVATPAHAATTPVFSSPQPPARTTTSPAVQSDMNVQSPSNMPQPQMATSSPQAYASGSAPPSDPLSSLRTTPYLRNRRTHQPKRQRRQEMATMETTPGTATMSVSSAPADIGTSRRQMDRSFMPAQNHLPAPASTGKLRRDDPQHRSGYAQNQVFDLRPPLPPAPHLQLFAQDRQLYQHANHQHPPQQVHHQEYQQVHQSHQQQQAIHQHANHQQYQQQHPPHYPPHHPQQQRPPEQEQQLPVYRAQNQIHPNQVPSNQVPPNPVQVPALPIIIVDQTVQDTLSSLTISRSLDPVPRQGRNVPKTLHTGHPTSLLNRFYNTLTPRLELRSDDFIVWQSHGSAHDPGFSAVFLCPLDDLAFASILCTDFSNCEVTQELAYFENKKEAKAMAAWCAWLHHTEQHNVALQVDDDSPLWCFMPSEVMTEIEQIRSRRGRGGL